MLISVIILTKNEAATIRDCIASVLWADEIIVIDDHSEDKTAQQAKESGALVYFHELARDFAGQRNFGLSKAKGEWVLFLDADERVSPSLAGEIQQVITSRRNRYEGYRLKRRDHLFGRVLKHGETSTISFLRLGKRTSGTWKGSVHETWEMSGHVGILTEAIDHYPHQTIAEFLTEINFYTDLRADELYRERVQSSWYTVLLYTKGKFIRNYFLKFGFLDGMPGLIMALMMSFHSFLVRSKLWLKWQKKHYD